MPPSGSQTEKVLRKTFEKPFRLPEEVGSLIRGGDELHSASATNIQHKTQWVFASLFRPILVGLPLVILHKLCDHHNHRHLEKYNVICQRISSPLLGRPYARSDGRTLVLEPEPPGRFAGSWGRLSYWHSHRPPIKERGVLHRRKITCYHVLYLFWALEHLTLQVDVVVIIRS